MNEDKKCKICKIELRIGYTIDYKNPKEKSSFSYFSDGKLVKCWKCPKCGYSESIYE